MGRPIKIAKAQSVFNITETSAVTNLATTNANLIAEGVRAGMPFVTSANVGGLVAGTTYWFLNIPSATTFSVSATDLSTNTTKTPVVLSNASAQTVATTVGLVDSGFNNPAGSANTYGVVGGDTAIYGNQAAVVITISKEGVGTITTTDDSDTVTGVGTDFEDNTKFTTNTVMYTNDGTYLGTVDTIANATSLTLTANATTNVTGESYIHAIMEPGFIVRQKGKTKYLVKGATTGEVAALYTTNSDMLSLQGPNTVLITGLYANSDPAIIESLNSKNSQVFYDANVANANPDFYATFNSSANANVSAGVVNPVVTISKA